MNKSLVTVIAGVLVLLTACVPGALKAKPINTTLQEKLTACEGVSCPEFSSCVEGECVCSAGFKKCGDKCIAEAKCCADADCAEGKACLNGVCAFPRKQCEYNEEWDEERGKCFCAEGFKFCGEQQKCVPVDNCCWHTDCTRDYRCVPTNYAIAYCLTGDGKEKCTVSPQGRRDSFAFASGRYEVIYQDIKEGGKIFLNVNGTRVEGLDVNQTRTVGPLSLVVTHVEEFGGFCKEDIDDTV